jgi:transglutaminase TgpA-like protein/transglutaminase superfamily protein/uncharacterized protein DUF4129
MEHAQGTPPRTQRLIALFAMSVVATATALAFGRVFAGHGSTWRLVLVGLASAVVACALERRNLLLAALVSAAGLAVAIGVSVFPATTWHGLPTLDTLRHAIDAAKHVGEQARLQVAPTPPLSPLILAAATAVWAAVFSSHALAFRAGSPILALLPPAALVAFADTVLEEFIKPWYGVAFLGAGLAVIFADSLRRVQAWGPVWVGPGSRARLSATASRGARRVAAAALAFAAFVPVVVPGFGSQAVIDISSTASGDRVRIDPLVSIKASLSRKDPVEVFRVTTNRLSYWRLLSLPDFDGTTWHPDPAVQGEPITPETQLMFTVPEMETIDQTFVVSNDLDLPWLPVAYPVARVDVPDGSASYDPDSGTIATDGGLDAGTEYRASSIVVSPSPTVLATEVLPTPAQNTRYTRLPSDMPPEILDLAREWTAGAANDYERVLAIQDHLNDESVFIYSEDVPARDDSFTLLDFLTVTHEGFCQQFASAMAVMLRGLGIPARVTVGFTSGTWDADTKTATVTTEQAHSWVEVLFPSFGWLAFEPTPGRVNPTALPYVNPAAGCSALPDGCDGTAPQAPGDFAEGPAADLPGQLKNLLRQEPGIGTQIGSRLGPLQGAPPNRTRVSTGRIAPRTLVVGVAAVVASILLLVPLVRAARRRIRLRRVANEPRRLILTTYDVFTERAADLGYPRGPGETINEYRARMHGSGPPPDGDLDRLSAVTGSAAYSAGDPGDAEVREAEAAAQAALRNLRRATPISRRVAGLYRLPR